MNTQAAHQPTGSYYIPPTPHAPYSIPNNEYNFNYTNRTEISAAV